ncbi:acyl carrier protein [Acidiphilium multivorum]|uniref:Acyl carrier protein n=2 Tax=Acidiphilium TaxID=522 RepID=A5G224_ACICJ|nr:hypothetical protein Acry_2715 [Acidiphilium cryptum JF-5]EGO94197.1 hypothetical protein APM_2994 [Acidiphilium sp. PM]KDM65976.1 acyl carrier protein [Acidiphilium sp. JA12-A1]MBS3023610.1 acyl carrier protein [Acidiphilium multivorum]MBU6357986.1 acyl carrier protein [Rhodospirillales bacterium]GAN75359.1 hypothetical protein Apmu_0334_06 [Acidiphilium multivorum AIU301]
MHVRMADQADDVSARVGMIFARLFPDLAPTEIARASTRTVRAWDSITTLSLIVEAEDEFGIVIGFDRMAAIESFSDLCHIVARLRREQLGRLSGSRLLH